MKWGEHRQNQTTYGNRDPAYSSVLAKGPFACYGCGGEVLPLSRAWFLGYHWYCDRCGQEKARTAPV